MPVVICNADGPGSVSWRLHYNFSLRGRRPSIATRASLRTETSDPRHRSETPGGAQTGLSKQQGGTIIGALKTTNKRGSTYHVFYPNSS
jgi:hypothetical protein